MLLAAGGAMRDRGGRDFAYGKSDYYNGGFLAVGDPAAFDHVPAL